MDNCCFNRPFDDQRKIRIKLEAEAKLYIQEKIRRKEFELAWSYILDHENQANPFGERKRAIQQWKHLAVIDVGETPEILENRIGGHNYTRRTDRINPPPYSCF